MTRRRYDKRDTRAAEDRLDERYPVGLTIAGPMDRLWMTLATHAHYATRGPLAQHATQTESGDLHDALTGKTFPKPTEQDLLDGLTLVDDERNATDYREIRLIDAAVDAGVSWKQIGVALGHTAETAEKAAQARRAELQRQVEQYGMR